VQFDEPDFGNLIGATGANRISEVQRQKVFPLINTGGGFYEPLCVVFKFQLFTHPLKLYIPQSGSNAGACGVCVCEVNEQRARAKRHHGTASEWASIAGASCVVKYIIASCVL
jgi:hypothetical protein